MNNLQRIKSHNVQKPVSNRGERWHAFTPWLCWDLLPEFFHTKED